MKNSFKIQFDARSDNERFARMVASAFVVELDPTVSQLSELKTAVSEAVTNAVIHGYAEKNGIITMEGVLDGDSAEFTITDEGEGIEDIEKARLPMYTGRPELERSGMGFTIMESFTDELKVISKPGKGTSVYMRKRMGTYENEQ